MINNIWLKNRSSKFHHCTHIVSFDFDGLADDQPCGSIAGFNGVAFSLYHVPKTGCTVRETTGQIGHDALFLICRHHLWWQYFLLVISLRQVSVETLFHCSVILRSYPWNEQIKHASVMLEVKAFNPSWTMPACASVHCWTTLASQNTPRKSAVLFTIP